VATLIDSLVISLGIDSTKFVDGQTNAEASMTTTRDAALKQSKDLSTANKKFAESFTLITRPALEFFAVIAGTNSVKTSSTTLRPPRRRLGA